MSDTLPAVIIPQLEELGRALHRVVQEHPDDTLAALEQTLLGVIREFSPRLLAAVLTASQCSLQPDAQDLWWPCPGCGTRSGSHEWRDRTVRTVCGKMTFERPWHICPQCQRGFSPTDQQLELAPRARLSPGLQEWVITQGAQEASFAEAAKTLGRLTGIGVSDETVRQHTERRGQALAAADAAAIAQVQQTQEAAEPVDPAPGHLVVETDGVMVRYLSGWHEVKLGVVGGQVDGELVALSYCAARESAEAFGPRLLAEAGRRGALEILEWEGSPLRRQRAVLREVIIVGDGARWIWVLADEHFGTRVEIVDFYHAAEHLWTVARAVYGEGTVRAKTWAETQIERLQKKGVKPVRRALGRLRAKTPAAAEVLRRERGYFRTNAARMAYPTFRERGLPIGSGAVESSAGHLVQQRMKRSNAMRWSEAGAHGVLTVRCRLLSNRPISIAPVPKAA